MPDLHQMQHAFAHDPVRRRDRFPAGAVAAGDEVALRLRVDSSVRESVHGVWLELLDEAGARDAGGGDSARADAADTARAGSVGPACGGAWASIPMEECDGGYLARVDTSGEPRVLFYRFRIATEIGELRYAKRTDGITTAGSAFLPSADLPVAQASAGFQLTVFDGAFAAPAWFSGSVMYQAFPDRFARDDAGIRWEGVEAHRRRGWEVRVHEDWNEPPLWGEPYDPVDFFGGTFAGIEDKLDYLVSLGVGVLYLNPVCEARSNHRYDTGDYEQVDPLLGTWDDFERLARAAEKRGIRIILDTVLSHTGATSRYFNLDGSYDSVGAAQGCASPYRSWYDFACDGGGAGYRCWWGDPTLPEVDERDPSWQRFVLGDGPAGAADSADPAGFESAAGEPGVLGQWAARGAAGFRLDVADEIPDDVLELVRASAKLSCEEAVVIGEVWEDPTTKESYGSRRTYALGRSLDSVMNYPLRSALLRYALGSDDAQHLVAFLKLQRSNYPGPLYASLMNLLSSHDVERVRSVLACGAEFRERPRDEQAAIVSQIGWEADARGAALQRILATVLYALPGVPCLYYGDERGMQGGRDPFDRATFPWGVDRADCGQDLSWLYKGLGGLRRASVVLRHGDAAFYAYGKDVVCVLRTPGDIEGRSDAVICVANRSNEFQRVVVDLVDPAAGLSERDVMRVKYADANPRRIFSTDGAGADAGTEASCEFGIFSCGIGPMQACVFHLGHGLDKPLERGAGVICHITSVPNEDASGRVRGRGNLGAPARRFVDALAAAGVRYWQILPLNPTDEYGSPYAGLSAFAGNPLLLDDFDASAVDEEAFRTFVAENREWLLPYATFTAIKKVHGETPWQDWPERYRAWIPGLENEPELRDAVREAQIVQFAFERQWADLRAYANERGVSIIGDMPIYVSADSADVWSHRDYFELDEHGRVARQGGVPPDQMAEAGQLWGSPTYRWDELRSHGYDWWLSRLGRMFAWYDYVRIDHFLGFSAYYSIPEGRPAGEGEWMPGPGLDFFKRAYDAFGPLPMIAEDLGIVTSEVRQLLAQTGFAGMDVALFADGDPRFDWAPKRGKISFTGTHDTPTLVGWARERYCGGADDEASREEARRIAHDLVDAVADSSADVVVFPLQDVLELDDDARMNVPGTAGGNWGWQARQADVDAAAPRLSRLTRSRR